MVTSTVVVPTGTGIAPLAQTFSVDAKMDITGQCSSLVTHVEYGDDLLSTVYLDLQKRHKYARFSMIFSSDHNDPCGITVYVKTPGRPTSTYHFTIGLKGTLYWHFCSPLGLKSNVTRHTVWEIWTPTGVESKSCHILNVSFRKCQNSKEELLGESFGVSDGEFDTTSSDSEQQSSGESVSVAKHTKKRKHSCYSPLPKDRKK